MAAREAPLLTALADCQPRIWTLRPRIDSPGNTHSTQPIPATPTQTSVTCHRVSSGVQKPHYMASLITKQLQLLCTIKHPAIPFPELVDPKRIHDPKNNSSLSPPAPPPSWGTQRGGRGDPVLDRHHLCLEPVRQSLEDRHMRVKLNLSRAIKDKVVFLPISLQVIASSFAPQGVEAIEVHAKS